MGTRNHLSFESTTYYCGPFRYKTTESNDHSDRHLKIAIAQAEHMYIPCKARGSAPEKITAGNQCIGVVFRWQNMGCEGEQLILRIHFIYEKITRIIILFFHSNQHTCHTHPWPNLSLMDSL